MAMQPSVLAPFLVSLSLMAAIMFVVSDPAGAQAPCVPTASIDVPLAAGAAGMAIDGLDATFIDVANPGESRPDPRLIIDFCETREFVRLRRRMTRDGSSSNGNRGANGEAIYLATAGVTVDPVVLSSQATSGWESHVPRGDGWQNVVYGWTNWLELDGAPVFARYVVFDWQDDFDALNEIEVEFRGVPPVDLWVGLEGTAEFGDSVYGFGSRGAVYTASYANRGTQALSGVVLTLSLQPGVHLGREDCPFFEMDPGWSCDWPFGNGQTCSRPLGTLEPGANATLTLRSCPVSALGWIETRALTADLRIRDNGLNGQEATPLDNTAAEVLTGSACPDGVHSTVGCCALWTLFCLRNPEAPSCLPDDGTGPAAAIEGAYWGPLRWLGDSLSEAVDSIEFMHLLYRVREHVFAATPGGRRATQLYETHGPAIKAALLGSATLRNQATAALGAWEANLEALVAGRGGEARVSAAQVASITNFLSSLRAVAGPSLRAAIDDGSAALGLASWTGLDLNQALARLNLLDCENDPTTLCLRNGRFRVETFWKTPQGQAGAGRATALTDDAGTFWFFNAANVEVIVKALDGCPVNGRKWIFAAGLTNVRVSMVVTDTETGAIKTYVNPSGATFQPIQDTAAFASCP